MVNGCILDYNLGKAWHEKSYTATELKKYPEYETNQKFCTFEKKRYIYANIKSFIRLGFQIPVRQQ